MDVEVQTRYLPTPRWLPGLFCPSPGKCWESPVTCHPRDLSCEPCTSGVVAPVTD
jgi:hypothetical protein